MNEKISDISSKIEELDEKISNGFKQMIDYMENISTIINAQTIHPKSFLDYKNAFTNKDVCVVCTGPTAKYYTPMDDVIHIGINNAFEIGGIKFDILFNQDLKFNKGRENEIDDLCKYRPNHCIKFLGICPQNLSQQFMKQKKLINRIPLRYFSEPLVRPYIIEAKGQHNWAYDLSIEPIGNFVGTVFSALQFILYTNPRRIYLVGCDCTSGHVNRCDTTGVAPYQFYAWTNIFRQIVVTFHPNLEVVSINPVKLKGYFNDIYTDSYKQNNINDH